MGMRLPRLRRRDPVPSGRHARIMPAVSVPGAAATLVGSATLDPTVTGAWLPPAMPEAPEAPAPPPPGVPTVPTVGLVFADGDSVQLDHDDPRVRTFRAAAAALLDHTEV